MTSILDAGAVDARSRWEHLLALLEVTRPSTSVVAGLLALLGLRMSGAGALWPLPAVVGLAAGWTLLAQAVFAVNDYFDAPIDAVAQPSRPIPSGRVQPRGALRLGLALGGFGAALLTLVSLPLGLVALIYGATSWLYCARVKSWNGPAANATVAGLIALVPLSVGAAGAPIGPLWWIPIPIFLGVFAREILNDIEDSPGDRRSGRPTVPLTVGYTAAYRLSAASWIGFALASYLPAIVQPEARTPLYVSLASILNLVILGVAIVLLRERTDLLARLQRITKLALVAYILVILAVLRLGS